MCDFLARPALGKALLQEIKQADKNMVEHTLWFEEGGIPLACPKPCPPLEGSKQVLHNIVSALGPNLDRLPVSGQLP